MQRLEQLWKVVAFAGQMRDLAIGTRTYQFRVEPDMTFYAHVEHSHVHIEYHDAPDIVIDAEYQAQFGWRAQVEQDEHGVYLVAKRRVVVGSVSTARFRVRLPGSTYIVLRLEQSSYTVHGITQEVHLPALR